MLDDFNIPTSTHFIVNHLDPEQEAKFEEYEDYIVINGFQMNKPFVEKPVYNLISKLIW